MNRLRAIVGLYGLLVVRIVRDTCMLNKCSFLILNIPSLGRQRYLPSWGPRRTQCFFVISQLFDAVDYSKYVFWISETIIQ